MNNNYIVLLAGGSGTRLWPVSRKDKPKQFHKFTSENSLLQDTFDRVKNLVPKENIYVSLGKGILAETQKQLPDIPKENYIVEPIGKNTGPSIVLVTAKIFKINPLAVIATISSDHTVKKVSNYQTTFKQAFDFVSDNPKYFCTIGIKPEDPNTGYGYIKIGNKIANSPAHEVEMFVEKPDLETAEIYLKSGKYLWNGGYFIFRVDNILKMLEKHAPALYVGFKNILSSIDTSSEEKVISEEFDKFEKIPIEPAIIEKADNITVIPSDMGWSDVGSWTSLYDLLKDEKSDIVKRGHHIGIDDKNCLFIATDKLLATVGLEDIIVVDTPDVTLVCHKDRAQDIKKMVEKLKTENKHQYL